MSREKNLGPSISALSHVPITIIPLILLIFLDSFLPTDASLAMAVHRLLSCIQCTTSTAVIGLSTSWYWPSIIYAVFLSDDHLLPFQVVWFSAAYCAGRHGRTTITCDAWWMSSVLFRWYAPTVLFTWSSSSSSYSWVPSTSSTSS